MNNAKLCVAVIILCLVTPIMVGYAWPVDSETTVNYELGSARNISSDLETDVGVYSNYTDYYMNNEFVFLDPPNDYQPSFYNEAVSTTTTDTGLPDYYDAEWIPYVISPGDLVHDGMYFYTLDLDDFIHNHYVGSKMYIFNKGNADELEVGPWVCDTFVYFPQSNMGWIYDNYYRSLLKIDNIPSTLTFSYGSTSAGFFYSRDGGGVFVDLNEGFYTPYYQAEWFNGFEQNRGIEVLVKPSSNGHFAFDIIGDRFEHRTRVYVLTDSSGNIRLGVNYLDSSLPAQYESLGNLSVYSMVLLKVDYESHTISLTGLMGMNGFLDDYQQKSRNSVSVDWKEPIEFRSIQPYSSSANTHKWFVPRTYSEVATAKGIYGHLELRDYTATNAQIQIRNLQLWDAGRNFYIQVNGTTYYGEISLDGKVTIPAIGGKTYNLNNLIVALIDRTVYINGEPLVESSSPITSLDVSFISDWVCSLYYYPINAVAGHEYEWERAGFGLDVDGFCMVGLITSAFTGIGASLYGRRSGVKVFGVTMVTGIISAVYLIVLMGGL